MDLSSWLFVPGVVGGVIVAILLRVLGGRRSSTQSSDVFAHRASVTGSDVINVSAIRVAGLGGLGLVGMALALAWTFPRIGQTIVIGAALGAGMAGFLIWRRRRAGALPADGGRAAGPLALTSDAAAPETVHRPEHPDTHESDSTRLVVESA
jgi:hypothetical protein